MSYPFIILIPLSLCDDLISFLLTVFVLCSTLSHTSIATPVFSWFPRVWDVFFHPFAFGLCVFVHISENLVGKLKMTLKIHLVTLRVFAFFLPPEFCPFSLNY